MKDKWDNYWAEVHAPDGEKWKGIPHGWVQWKGTDACVDLHCECGAHGHIDAEFFYHYECLSCGRKYALSGYVRLIELSHEAAEYVANGGDCDFLSDPRLLEESESDQP